MNRMVVVLLATLLAQACVTRAVLHRARDSRDTAEIKEIRSARLEGQTLFVELGIRRHGSEVVEPLVLPVSINDLGRPQGGENRTVERDGLTMLQVTTLNLQPLTALPEGGTPIDIEELIIGDEYDLWRQKDLGEGVHVVRLFHDVPSYHYPKGPYLALFVNRPHPGGNKRAVIPDFNEGSRVKPSWYLVVPAAAAVDVVSFPVQIFAAIMKGHE